MSLDKAPTLPNPSSLSSPTSVLSSKPPLHPSLSYPSPASSSGSLGSSHYYGQDTYPQPYPAMEFGNHHLSQSQPPPPHTAAASTGLAHYASQPVPSSYHHPSTHGGFHHAQFQYPTQTGVSSPHPAPVSTGAFSAAQVAATLLPMQRGQMAASPSSLVGPSPGTQGTQTVGVPPGGNYPQPFDTTGQVAPPGMKPRVTATLWEDEGSLCFQVEAKGVCVARREDNHMINGTKLLNVAGMTRGRRDGILKSEKIRHVVKIGPMHLKGVWIPFERALDFANKEKITELLYPLFVHNIGALLYHPTNSHRTNAVMAAAERRRFEPHQRRVDGIVTSSPSQAGPGGMHHHPSMHTPMQHLPSHHAMPGHHNPHLARPGIERSVSFPTPPSSASSMMGIGGTADHQFWNGSNMVPNTQSLTIDTVINSRSMPSTPATTPPSGSLQQMQNYSTSNSYDSFRTLNPPPSISHQPQSQQPTQQSQQSQDSQQQPQHATSQQQQQQNVAQQNMARFGPPGSQPQSQYMSQVRNTSDMGPPPTSRSQPNSLSRPSSRQNDPESKAEILEEPQGLVPQPVGHEGDNGDEEADHEADHEHDDEYTHDAQVQSYGARAPYYTPVTSMTGEHGAHISPELANSTQSSQPGGGSNRSPYANPNVAVPRTVEAPSAAARNAGTSQPHWASSSGYSTPPRAGGPNRYDGSGYQGATGGDRGAGQDSQSDSSYQVPPVMSLQGSYSQPPLNGAAGTKRMRDDDDDDQGSRPSSHHGDDSDGGAGIKRRKTGGALGSSPVIGNLQHHPGTFDRDSGGKLNRRTAAIVQQQRRR